MHIKHENVLSESWAHICQGKIVRLQRWASPWAIDDAFEINEFFSLRYIFSKFIHSANNVCIDFVVAVSIFWNSEMLEHLWFRYSDSIACDQLPYHNKFQCHLILRHGYFSCITTCGGHPLQGSSPTLSNCPVQRDLSMEIRQRGEPLISQQERRR